MVEEVFKREVDRQDWGKIEQRRQEQEGHHPDLNEIDPWTQMEDWKNMRRSEYTFWNSSCA